MLIEATPEDAQLRNLQVRVDFQLQFKSMRCNQAWAYSRETS